MRVAFVVILGCLFAAPVHAQEPVGCDKFKWPLDQERSLLTSSKTATVASGSSANIPAPCRCDGQSRAIRRREASDGAAAGAALANFICRLLTDRSTPTRWYV